MVVIDNSCLSSLYFIRNLEILSFFFDTILIPRAVYKEFIVKTDEQSSIKNFDIIDKLNSLVNFVKEYPKLKNYGIADIEAIHLALRRKDLLITDDLKMRKFCKSVGINVIGTLRLLRNGYESGYFSTVENYFTVIDKLSTDLYLSEELIKWAKEIN